MKITFLLALLFFCLKGVSQTEIISVYFETNSARILPEYQQRLDSLLDAWGYQPPALLRLDGHTDSIGGDGWNLKLSAQRIAAVRNYLDKAKALTIQYQLNPFGLRAPLATNANPQGRSLNRCVRMSWENASGEMTEAPAADHSTIEDLYALLATPVQTYLIDNTRDTVIRGKQGTVIYIPAFAFKAGCGNRNIRFTLKEDYKVSDMVLDRLTTTSNDSLLESQGMIYTEAFDCANQSISLKEGRQLKFVTPTDTIRKDAGLFTGHRDQHQIMNWVSDGNDPLPAFTAANLKSCGWYCLTGVDSCSSCGFFCRLGHRITAAFSKQKKEEYRLIKGCRERQRRLRNNPPPPPCLALDSLFKQFGVKDRSALIRAIEKLETLDSSGFEALNFYMFSRSSLGWVNIDCFSVDTGRKCAITVDLQPDPQTACHLVFPDRKSILPLYPTADHYGFNGVPAGIKTVLIVLQYRNYRPYLYMQTFPADTQVIKPEMKEVSLAELKERMKILD